MSRGLGQNGTVPGSRNGLCAECQHCRIVKTERSTFFLCRRSFTQPEYPKYPPVPVIQCRGYEPGSDEGPPVPDDKLKT